MCVTVNENSKQRIVEIYAVALLPPLDVVTDLVSRGFSVTQIRDRVKRPLTMRYVLEDDGGNRQTVEIER